MSKEQFESLLSKLTELRSELEVIPGSSSNGQLIDASTHLKCSAEHLKRYVQITGVGK